MSEFSTVESEGQVIKALDVKTGDYITVTMSGQVESFDWVMGEEVVIFSNNRFVTHHVADKIVRHERTYAPGTIVEVTYTAKNNSPRGYSPVTLRAVAREDGNFDFFNTILPWEIEGTISRDIITDIKVLLEAP